MSVLHLDWESRGTVDLTKCGVYVYAQHRHTDLWCGAWAFDEEEPVIWRPGLPVPVRVIDHISNGGEVVAHNAQFERVMMKYIAHPRYGWPVGKIEQFRCTAAEAAAMSLPRSLGQVAEVLRIKQQKDSGGHKLMLQMCKPRAYDDDGEPIWWDVPDKIEKLEAYCMQDVHSERGVEKCLRRLSSRETQVYYLDQRMNDRGIRCDRELVIAAQKIVREGMDRANATLEQVTDGQVTSVTQNKRLAAWLTDEGVENDGVAKARIVEMLATELTPNVRVALEQRAEAGRASVAKLISMLRYACTDDRMRGLTLYHGAGTGRWSGRGVQPHNFPRGEVEDIEGLIPYVLDGDYDMLALMHQPIPAIVSMLRSMMTAAPGNEFLSGDFSAIEARVLNWLAAQNDIVALFAAGVDIYKRNAMKLYGIPLAEVRKFPERQTGKFQELGCGFQMGAGKAVSAAKDQYGLTITDELAEEIVSGYRKTHPKVVAFWYETEDACIRAVDHPGEVQVFGGLRNLKCVMAGAYLYIILPCGRPLCYAEPGVKEREVVIPATALKPEVRFMKRGLEFSGIEPLTKKWGRMRAYGGLLVENIVQGTARDIMAEAMLRLEDEGTDCVLTVHDDLTAECEPGRSLALFLEIISQVPSWATGCPIAAEGWQGFRYRK